MKYIKILVLALLVLGCVDEFKPETNELKSAGIENPFLMVGNYKQISVNQEFSESGTLPVKISNVYGLSIDADIKLKNENSFVRVILNDEYLVYEGYLLIASPTHTINRFAEETLSLDGIEVSSIDIEIKDATICIEKLNFFTNPQVLDKKTTKEKQNKEKISKINKKAQWFAGITSVSKLTYKERKQLYGQSTFPLGFEYYSGGVITTSQTQKSTSTIGDFDWRDIDGVNYVTSIKNQGGCGSCWAFAVAGAVEANINIYYQDETLDFDLSEEELVTCSGAGDCYGGLPYRALNYVMEHGITDEETLPYTASNGECVNPEPIVSIAGSYSFGSNQFPRTEDVLKNMIIDYGVLSGGLYDWSHAMPLVGFLVIEEGDVFYYRGADYSTLWKTVEYGDKLIGKTVWIFKNSWGDRFGDDGYVYVETPMDNFGWTHAIKTPIYVDGMELPEPEPEPDIYCVSAGDGVAYITNVGIDGVNYTSGSDGYGNFTDRVFNLSAGEYKTNLIAESVKKPAWQVWIDFNKNGVFQDNEQVYINKKRGIITIPEGITGNTRMRVSMKNSKPATACENYFNGEVEDYTIFIN